MATTSQDQTPSKWSMTWDVVRRARLMTPRVVALLSSYFLLTPLNAIADGMAWLLLVNVFSANAGLGAAASGMTGRFLGWLPAEFMANSNSQLIAVCILFLVKATLTVAIYTFEGAAQAEIRRALQEHCLGAVMRGRWDFLRQGNVGQWVGTVTEESVNFSGYFIMGARALYALIMFALLAGMAVLVNPKLSLLMLVVALPVGLMLRLLYHHHAGVSSGVAAARQRFSADATERLSGLFQIKAFGDIAPHLKAGAASQEDFTRRETSLGFFVGLINAFTPLLLPILLVAFALWTSWQGQSLSAQLHVLGSVGILGYRAASQLSVLISSIGVVTSFSGCVAPVRQLCLIPSQPEHEHVPETLVGIELEGVGYAYNDQQVLRDQTLSIALGRIFLITGESGGGKTTLANLISALYEPNAGAVVYVGASGRRYDARKYRAKIGYVTQDVFLFRGTVRRNLDPWGERPEDELWRCLELAGAAAFVRSNGGLDAEIAEAGRSLSGGERRRLAIAATLAQRADCLVLDEVTNGLDEASKRALVETISALSRKTLAIAISHDLAAFDKTEATMHALAPRRKAEEPA
jgi:ABC-type multidrug transport system fused ATPase/permease subunit